MSEIARRKKEGWTPQVFGRDLLRVLYIKGSIRSKGKAAQNNSFGRVTKADSKLCSAHEHA